MKISLVIVSYNQAKYLAAAIESALAQTLAPFEIIITDDGSTDQSRTIIESFASLHEELVRPVFSEENRGVAANRNRGLEVARGDWITFLDSDDMFDPEKLEREAEIVRAGGAVDLVYSNFRFVDSEGQPLRLWTELESMPEGHLLETIFPMAFPRWILFRSELVRRELWSNVGCFDERLDLYEDYDMRIRLAKKANVAYCDHVGSSYRKHETGLSRTPLFQHVEALDYVMKKNRPLLDDLAPEVSLAIRRECGRILRYYCRRCILQEKTLRSLGRLRRAISSSPIA